MTESNPVRHPLLRVLAAFSGIMVLLVLAVQVMGSDKIRLTDGTELEGEVTRIGSVYQIKLPDGTMRVLPEGRIESINGKPPGEATAGGAQPGARQQPRAGGGQATAPSTGHSRDFEIIRDRCERIEEPVRAVALWENFLERKDISQRDRTAAERELARWRKLYNDNAEKIRGSWVGGEELEAIKKQAEELVLEGYRLEQGAGGTLAAIRNYREAIRIYPNSFGAHFRLAYIELEQAQGPGSNPRLRAARRSLEAALRLQPDNPAVLNNYGACMFALGEYERGIVHMWRAVRRAETDIIVGNLLTAIESLPPRVLQSNPRIREVFHESRSLRRAGGSGRGLYYINDPGHGLDIAQEDPQDPGPPGLRGNGSGFFITPDGYLLTNRHVAETDRGQYYRVRLDQLDDDGNHIEVNARFVAADTQFDVALLKASLPEGMEVPYLSILGRDHPPIAAQVMVLGYPATRMHGPSAMTLQVATGTVRSINPGDEHEVWFDLSTTHGNSGGPIVDRNGHVVGILTAGRTVYNVTYVLGVGPRQIREFFDRIGDKAPALDHLETPALNDSFDSETLAEQCKSATLLVLIFRGNLDDARGDTGGGGDDDDAPPPPPSPDSSGGAEAETPPD